MIQIKKYTDTNVSGKYVLLRDDFNVQIVDGKITDSFRIDASMPTIKYLISSGARVVICSHLGKPKGQYNEYLSLRPIAEYLNIPFIEDCLSKDFLSEMHNGDVVLLENLRFYNGEETNNMDFAHQLSKGFDIYINDAFAVSHRVAASVIGITNFLPSYAGDLLIREVENLTNVMNNPIRPLIAFIGGSKISTKIGVLNKLISIADKIIIGGAMGTTFNFAKGLSVGNSLYEESMAQTALNILELADKNNCEIFLPLDKGVGKSFAKEELRINRDVTDIKDDDVIMDDGDKTIERNLNILQTAKTVIWNGTFGMAEWQNEWGKATFSLANGLADYTKKGIINSIVGGGDTVAALDWCNVRSDMTYVSTGGGAFLEFLEGKILPGINVLLNN